MTDPNEPSQPCKWMALNGIGELAPQEQYLGLTKREHFAAMAMQGLISTHQQAVAEQAVFFADVLIRELNKENGSPSDTVSDSSDREAR